MPKRILVVAHDPALRTSRVKLLESKGYLVEGVRSDDEAMAAGVERFDLVLLGRRSASVKVGLDQRLREAYPKVLILKIAGTPDDHSSFPSRSIGSEPTGVLLAIREMLR